MGQPVKAVSLGITWPCYNRHVMNEIWSTFEKVNLVSEFSFIKIT